jgi:hypothetical protein
VQAVRNSGRPTPSEKNVLAKHFRCASSAEFAPALYLAERQMPQARSQPRSHERPRLVWHDYLHANRRKGRYVGHRSSPDGSLFLPSRYPNDPGRYRSIAPSMWFWCKLCFNANLQILSPVNSLAHIVSYCAKNGRLHQSPRCHVQGRRSQLATVCLKPKHRLTLSICWNAGVDSAALLGAIGSERKQYGRLVAGHADCGGVHRRSHTARVPRRGVDCRDVASPQRALSAAALVRPTFSPAYPPPCSQRSDTHSACLNTPNPWSSS